MSRSAGSPFTSQGGRTIGFVNEQGSDSVSSGVWTVTGSGGRHRRRQ
jgi:hypothetical protein